jgi:hypothetical protein
LTPQRATFTAGRIACALGFFWFPRAVRRRLKRFSPQAFSARGPPGAVGKLTGAVGKLIGAVGKLIGAAGKLIGAVGKLIGAAGKLTGAVGKLTGAAKRGRNAEIQSNEQ